MKIREVNIGEHVRLEEDRLFTYLGRNITNSNIAEFKIKVKDQPSLHASIHIADLEKNFNIVTTDLSYDPNDQTIRRDPSTNTIKINERAVVPNLGVVDYLGRDLGNDQLAIFYAHTRQKEVKIDVNGLNEHGIYTENSTYRPSRGLSRITHPINAENGTQTRRDTPTSSPKSSPERTRKLG